jgi:hypothetical protein
MGADPAPLLPVEYQPAPGRPGIEAGIARAIAWRGVWVGPVIVAVFALLRGGAGAIAAAVGVLIVAGNFLLSGWLLSAAAAVSLRLYHAAALFSFLIRLGLIAAMMFGVAALFEIDRPALGIAAVVAYLVLLVWEAAALTAGARKEYQWGR